MNHRIKNNIKRISIFLLVNMVCLFLLSACGKTNGNTSATSTDTASATDSSESENTNDAVTVMIYMVGSDLESSAAAATNDLEEISRSGVDSEKVNCIVFTGGCEDWQNDLNIPSDKNALLELTNDGFVKIGEYDMLSMGNSQNLSEFLSYGVQHYPADDYYLFLWNHGNGPLIGYGKDTLFDNDSMTLPELKEALENSPFKEQKLGIIGFDACLMASLELTAVVGDYADFLVSSQETEPSFGWNYAFMHDCGSVSNQELAVEITDSYMTYCEEFFESKPFFQNDVTMSVIDLSYADELGDSLDALFAQAKEHVSGDYNELARDRIGSKGMGRASTGSEYDLVDLYALADSMSDDYPNETKRIKAAIEQSVVVNKANISDSCGLSLYYPYYNKGYYRSSWKKNYSDMNLFPNYTAYLERYEQVWLGTELKDLYQNRLVPQDGEKANQFKLVLTEEQQREYARGATVIFKKYGEDLYSPIMISDCVENQNGVLVADYDGNVILCKDSEFCSIPSNHLTDWNDEKAYYLIYGTEVERGSPRNKNYEVVIVEYQVELDKQTGEVTVKNAYEVNHDENGEVQDGKQIPIDPKEWDLATFYYYMPSYLTRDDDGKILDFKEWEEKRELNGFEVEPNFTFTYGPLPNDGSDYFLAFRIIDTKGNYHLSELIPIDTQSISHDEDDTESDTTSESTEEE